MHQKKHFPIWLLCLLLFAGFLFLAIRLIPPFLAKNTAAQVVPPIADFPSPVSSVEPEVPDEEPEAETETERSVTAEPAEIVEEESPAVIDDSVPEGLSVPDSG